LGYFALGELPSKLLDWHVISGLNPNPVTSPTEYGFVQFFPQTLGMVTVSMMFAFYMWLKPCFGSKRISLREANKNCPFIQSRSYFNMIDGLVFASAALTILLSKAHNGTATATTLSQSNIIIATLGGLFILKERKPKKELASTLSGLTLVVAGAVIVGLLAVMFPGLNT
jgi:glucose uptake protein GlcU